MRSFIRSFDSFGHTFIRLISFPIYILYSGKFSRVLIFAVFADQSETAKIATAKLLTTSMHVTQLTSYMDHVHVNTVM